MTTTQTQSVTTQQPAGERADILETLQKHRGLFRVTTQGLTDAQARTRSTVSELTLSLIHI